MRILFLHTSYDSITAENKVHLNLVTNLDKGLIEPRFVWQSGSASIREKILSFGIDSSQVLFHDFGRNMSISPRPNRSKRARMMATRFPGSLMFLVKQVREFKPDIIYSSQQNRDLHFAAFLSKLFHVPHVIHVHYNVGPWLGRFVLKTIRKSKHIVAVSEYIRQNIMLNEVEPSNVHTVVNMMPLSTKSARHQDESIRVEFGWPEDAPLVVSVGRLDPGKGHLDLFEAFAKVIKKIPQARLLVCGSSTHQNGYESLLKQKTNELQLGSHIAFAGFRTDIPEILQESDVFCLPTQLEPCALVFFEAMRESLPVVAYYSGGVPEIINHNETGLLCYPGDISTLADNITTLLSDKELASRYGQSGKQRLVTVFDPKKISNRWFNILEQFV